MIKGDDQEGRANATTGSIGVAHVCLCQMARFCRNRCHIPIAARRWRQQIPCAPLHRSLPPMRIVPAPRSHLCVGRPAHLCTHHARLGAAVSQCWRGDSDRSASASLNPAQCRRRSCRSPCARGRTSPWDRTADACGHQGGATGTLDVRRCVGPPPACVGSVLPAPARAVGQFGGTGKRSLRSSSRAISSSAEWVRSRSL